MGLGDQTSSQDTSLLLLTLVQVPASMTSICMTAMEQTVHVHICQGRQELCDCTFRADFWLVARHDMTAWCLQPC